MTNTLTFSCQKYCSTSQTKLEKIFCTKLSFIENKYDIKDVKLGRIDFLLCSDFFELEEGIDYVAFEKEFIYFKTNHQKLNFLKQLLIPPVAFVGAGPGKKNWLTLEAYQLLQLADICFYDALVSQEVLEIIPATTTLYYVGKRGDSPSFNQQKINQLIVHHAKLNQKVVRLKGGDSTILGRIKEEIEQLNKFFIGYTITPGISAMQSLPSEAGLLTTQRGISDGVTLTTARQAGGKCTQISSRVKNTLVIYMGILKLEEIMQQLLNDGFDKNLPILIALNLTRPNKKIISATLQDIVAKAENHNIRPPGLIICGEVCRQSLLAIPPKFIYLGKKIFIYSQNKNKTLENEFIYWGAYSVTTLAKLPKNLSFFDIAIIDKKTTKEEKKYLAKSDCWVSHHTSLDKINKDFLTIAIS